MQISHLPSVSEEDECATRTSSRVRSRKGGATGADCVESDSCRSELRRPRENIRGERGVFLKVMTPWCSIRSSRSYVQAPGLIFNSRVGVVLNWWPQDSSPQITQPKLLWRFDTAFIISYQRRKSMLPAFGVDLLMGNPDRASTSPVRLSVSFLLLCIYSSISGLDQY